MFVSKPAQKGVGEKNGKNLWHYFKKSEDGGTAKCLLCCNSNFLKISQRSTTGLKTHLRSKHSLIIGQSSQQNKEVSSKVPSPSTSSQNIVEEGEVEELPKKKSKKTIDGYFIKENSMQKIVSRMVCKDGFSLNSFCKSSDLRYLFSNSGFRLPNSLNTIKSTVINFSNTVKNDMIIEFSHLKKQLQRFSLTFDEWTSHKNNRYLNVNVHHKETHFNLGLIRIHSSCTAENCIELIKERLASFGLEFETDIIGMTTDGVMLKVGKLVPYYQQLCFAHGIQLAVVDILYKKRVKGDIELTKKSLTDLDNDGDKNVEEINDELDLSMTIDRQPAEVVPDYYDIITKVRKVVKIFRKSPTKDDMYLQKYVKEDTGKDLSLILDCGTRWDSLFDMLDRFYSHKACIEKALIDIASELKFTDEEWYKIKNVVDSLHPLKLGVEVLCRRESTLITADTTFRFLLEKLDKQDTVLSKELSEALRARVKERRSEITAMLIYLQYPIKYDQELKTSNPIFVMPMRNKLRQEMKNILCRVIKDVAENIELVDVVFADNSQQSLENNLTLQEELEMQLKQDNEHYAKETENTKEKYFDKILKKEMAAFETYGVKGKYLILLHDYLLTIKPTSVEARRAFSAAAYICSIRSRFDDKTIDAICFLRSYFQKEK